MKRASVVAIAAAIIGTYLLVGAPSEAAVVGCPTPDATHVTVNIHNIAYNPSTETISAGVHVCWINNDGTTHTVTSGPMFGVDAAVWPNHIFAPGDSNSVQFSTPGTFPYHCNIHRSMHGTIVVPPPAPTVTGTTPASGDNNTNPTINGTATHGITVHVFSGATCNSELGTVTADGTTGNWSFTLNEAESITSGDTENFTAEASTPDDTFSACSSPPVSYTAGTTGPSIVLDSGPVDGAVIVTATPSWTFHSAFATAHFSCSMTNVGRQFLDCTATPPDGAFTPSSLAAGQWTFAIKAYDPASLTDERIKTFAITVDLADPTIKGARKTTARKPKFRLLGDPSLHYECKFDGGAFAAATVPATGAPFCQPTSRLRFGAHTVTAHALDTSGDIGADKVKNFKILRP